MQESKWKNWISYKPGGKAFRGFLCMLSFAAFIVGAVFTYYAIAIYGNDILTNPAESYQETTDYQVSMLNEIRSMLYRIESGYLRDISSGKVQIIDATRKKSYDIDAEVIRQDCLEGDSSLYQSLDPGDFPTSYILQTYRYSSMDMERYTDAKFFLSTYDKDNSYLYLDDSVLQKLFKENGIQNTDHWLSEYFSEDAYFVFDLQGSDLTDVYEALIAEDDNLEDRQEEASLHILENGENVENIQIILDSGYAKDVDISTEKYAVYDPEQNIYYSSWDDYFNEMGSYLYSVQELLSYIRTEDPDGNRYNSLIIPMLKCMNYDAVSFFRDEITNRYSEVMGALDELAGYEQLGISYRLDMGNTTYGNLTETAEEEGNYLDIYKVERTEDGFRTLSKGTDLMIASGLSEEEWELPEGSILTVAWDSVHAEDGETAFVRRFREYGMIAELIRYMTALAIFGLFLTIGMAVWLIRTTGKDDREGKKVFLCNYDKIPTEFWVIINLALLGLGLGGLSAGYYVLSDIVARGVWFFCAGCAAYGTAFAFVVMEVTLSVIRRVKAHNLKEQFAIVKWIQFLKRAKEEDIVLEEKEEKGHPFKKMGTAVIKGFVRVRDWVRNMKGMTRLRILVCLYLLFDIVVVLIPFLIWEWDIWMLCVLVFCLVQVLMFLAVTTMIKDTNRLVEDVEQITKGNLDSKVELTGRWGIYKELADGINHIGDGLKAAVETSLKDERMKTELITNVSHDLKTPLTSIINYINLLKTKEMPDAEAEHYVEVLDSKAQRLRQLTEDLVEAAKATSGNIELTMMPLAFDELMRQILGEYADKCAMRHLSLVAHYPEEPAMVMADGRRLFRIIENVLQNAYKYALEGTRIYVDLEKQGGRVSLTIKNISAAQLNISPDELMERFTRGDSSRTTEGSGLGLSIAKDLTRLMDGSFGIILDGDLFKVTVVFPEYNKEE